MRAALRYGLARLRVRRGRTLLAAAGIAAAAAMVGAGVTVAYGLASGFDRTARKADLPDVFTTFDTEREPDVARVVSALANVANASLRLQSPGEHLTFGDHYDRHTTVIGVPPGRQGYAVVRGRPLSGARDEVVIEAGLARAWHLHVGNVLRVDDYRGGFDYWRIVGVALSPDTVAFPLARGPRVYTVYGDERRLIGAPEGSVNSVALWLNDPHRLGVTLAQARSASIGLTGLSFVTRKGVRLLVGQAAGIVIALLVAFSIAALIVAVAMLSVSAAAEVQRRVQALAVLRAVGASTRGLVAAAAVEAALVAVPATAIGLIVGWLVVAGPTGRLLGSLNQLGPGGAVAPFLLASCAGCTLVVVVASALPTWLATRRSTIEALRRADVVGTTEHLPGSAGPTGLGLRLALARPLRMIGSVLVLGSAAAVILLILAIASVLRHLDQSPVALGKHYQLTVSAPASVAGEIASLPGVSAAAPRYETDAADSFELAEPFKLIAFDSASPTRFESPPLSEGRRRAGPGETEVGSGLADALGLHPGSVLAAQLPSGQELRFRVSGIVRALEEQGRVAYVGARPLLAADPFLRPAIAIRLAPGSTETGVRGELARAGYAATTSGGIAGQSVQGFAERSSGFLGILVALLRSVAVLNGAVCLYAIAQILVLTAHERRRAVALLRALGASRVQVAAVFGSAAVLIALLAATLGVVLERYAVAPAVAETAATYVTLSLGADRSVIAATAIALLLGSLLVAAWVGRAATARPVVIGLRED